MSAPTDPICPLSPLAPLPRLTAELAGIGGRLRTQIEDFEVEELPAYLPSGQGDHTWLWIEKRDLSGPMLRRLLAELLRIDAGDIGMAGLKDRRALTRQWLSVPARAVDPERAERALAGAAPRLRVLLASRHANKLRTGHLKGNRFCIRVRGASVSAGGSIEAPSAHAALAAKIERLRAVGMPNFYGEQRMGHGGATLAAGWALGQGLQGRVRVVTADGGAHLLPLHDRTLRRLAASALQSELFNRVVAERMARGCLDRVLEGDHCRKVDTGGSFVTDDPAREQQRLDRGELEITGPMWGPKMPRPQGEAAALEAAVLTASGLDEASFRRIGALAEGTRRPLRVRPEDLAAEWDGDDVVVRFGLPAGSFATVLLHELLGPHASEGDAFAAAADDEAQSDAAGPALAALNEPGPNADSRHPDAAWTLAAPTGAQHELGAPCA